MDRTILFAFLASLSAAFLVDLGPTQQVRPDPGGPTPRFAVQLDVDQAYFEVGDVARVRFLFSNGTDRDAHGWSPVRGGNGCEWRLTIEDAFGTPVYLPGTGCLFAETNQILGQHSTLERRVALPLVYRNSDGPEGQALPPGAYSIRFELIYFGPQPLPGSPLMPGTNPVVSIPIQIE